MFRVYGVGNPCNSIFPARGAGTGQDPGKAKPESKTMNPIPGEMHCFWRCLTTERPSLLVASSRSLAATARLQNLKHERTRSHQPDMNQDAPALKIPSTLWLLVKQPASGSKGECMPSADESALEVPSADMRRTWCHGAPSQRGVCSVLRQGQAARQEPGVALRVSDAPAGGRGGPGQRLERGPLGGSQQRRALHRRPQGFRAAASCLGEASRLAQRPLSAKGEGVEAPLCILGAGLSLSGPGVHRATALP